MARANRNFSQSGSQYTTCPPLLRRAYAEATNDDFHHGAYRIRGDCTKLWDTANSGCTLTASAASQASGVPPMPANSLRRLSFFVAFLSFFTIHLHEASLSLLISRGTCQLPVLDYAGEELSSKRAGLPTLLAFPRSARVARDDPSVRPTTPLRPFPDSSVFHHASLAATSPVDRSPHVSVQRSASSQITPTLSRTFSQESRLDITEQPANSTAFRSAPDALREVLFAGKTYFRTFAEVLKAPSPLPQAVPFMEDMLIAWHLLLQAAGSLLCGALADAKGRRWVLSRAVQVLGATSLLFTFTALTTAHLLRPSVENPDASFRQSAAGNIGSADASLFRNHDPTVLSEVPGSDCPDCQGPAKELNLVPIVSYLPTWLPSLYKLITLFPRLSAGFLWAFLLHILILVSVLCYSLAALACGGAAVVAQCLCLEAAACFPMRSTEDDAERFCRSAETHHSGNTDSPTVCGNATYAGSGRANESAQMGVATCAAGTSSKENSSESATARLYFVGAFADSEAQSMRVAELRSPLLAEGQRTSPLLGAARNVFATACVRTRSLFAGVWGRCRNTHAGLHTSFDATVRRFFSCMRTRLASMCRACVLPYFFSSPYIPVAYLMGIQSAAHLFLPVALSIILEAVSVSASSGTDSSGTPDKTTVGPLTSFPLFCLAFSMPVLPFCIVLCVLTSCLLRENPYFLFQRSVLLQHLSAVINPHIVGRLPAKYSSKRIPWRSAEKEEDAILKVRRTQSLPTARRCRTRKLIDEHDSGYPPSFSSSLTLPSHAKLDSVLQECGCGLASPGQRQFRERRLALYRTMAQRRRAFSGGYLDSFTSPEHDIFSGLTPSFQNLVSTPVLTERYAKRKHHRGSDLSVSRRLTIWRSRSAEFLPPSPGGGFSGWQDRPALSVQLSCTCTGTASLDAADHEIEGSQPEEAAADGERSATWQHYEGGRRRCSSAFDTGLVPLRAYMSYLKCNYSTSILGVLLPAAFIGASLYLRGIFRFLLLDCVVIEQEVEGTEAATIAARGTGFDLGSSSDNGVVRVEPSPLPQLPPSAGSPVTSSLQFSSSSPTVSPAILSKGDWCAQNVYPEFLLFRLSIPVLLVRLCTCLIPVFLLSTLPPKPLQMLGCIVCGFLSFGIVVTLEALTQNFPDIPPISSATTASLLYEIVFCFCCCVPAFTSVLLPLQGFHTGVRCGFAAMVSACSRGAAAVSLVGLSAWQAYFSSNLYAEDPGSTSKSGLEGLSAVSTVNTLDRSGADTFSSVGSPFSGSRERPTTTNDTCSAGAAFVAATTCVYYVVAAAFTLLYTTHVRFPRGLISPQTRGTFQQTDVQQTEPESGIRHVPFDDEHDGTRPERFRTMWWTQSVHGSTLVAVDHLLMQKLRHRMHGINVVGNDTGGTRGRLE